MLLRQSAIFVVLCFICAKAHTADTATLVTEDKLRDRPTPFAATVTTLHRLATVRIVDEQRDWYQVEADGGRRGWLPRQSLQLDTTPPSAPATTGTPVAPATNLLPRSVPRAANHALLLGTVPPAAIGLARQLGVPDGNQHQPTAPSPGEAEPLRQAFAGLEGRIGTDDRAFVYLGGERGDCTTPLATAEASTYLRELARRADKVIAVLESAGTPCSGPALNLPANGNTLALSGSRGLAGALAGCLNGGLPLATGDALRRCAQDELARHGQRQPVVLAGNPALVPAPGLADGTTLTPPALLQLLHAQRSVRREVTISALRPRYALADTLSFTITGPASGWLYLIAARHDGFTLLQTSPSATREPFRGRRSVTVAARDLGSGPVRLLALVTDSPRNFTRAGFNGANAPADARSLRDLPLEILVGDTSALCQRAETRNLGATQARQCSAAFGAALADVTIAP